MNEQISDHLEALISEVRASSKYRTVCESVVRNIGRHELIIRKSYKEAVKETRKTLHQIAGSYLRGRMRYDLWSEEIALSLGDVDRLKELCARYMAHHSSTRERLSLLPDFYNKIFKSIPTPHTIFDIGCGLNPLSIPWMPVPSDVVFHVCDLYTDQADFLNLFFKHGKIDGQASSLDIGALPPQGHADLAFMFKILPLIAHLPHATALSLLRTIDADHIVVSFPVRSLGGKEKGMMMHYERQFMDLVQEDSWKIERLAFESELVFIVTK